MFEETEQQNPAVLAGYLQKNKGEGKKKNSVFGSAYLGITILC